MRIKQISFRHDVANETFLNTGHFLAGHAIVDMGDEDIIGRIMIDPKTYQISIDVNCFLRPKPQNGYEGIPYAKDIIEDG